MKEIYARINRCLNLRKMQPFLAVSWVCRFHSPTNFDVALEALHHRYPTYDEEHRNQNLMSQNPFLAEIVKNNIVYEET